MQFTGSELIHKRNFYSQNNNFEVNTTLNFDNYNQDYYLGLSGDNVLELKFQSGKISLNNIRLGGYTAYQDFDISLQVTSGTLNILSKDIALTYGFLKSTGTFNYAYVRRGDIIGSTTFTLDISGSNTPNYLLSDKAYYITTGQTGVTGFFSNQGNYPIRVFDSSSLSVQNLTYNNFTGDILPINNSPYIINGDFSSYNFSVPSTLLFKTNFGNIINYLTIIDATVFKSFVFLNEISDFSFNYNNTINRNLSYLNYSGGSVVNNFNADLTFILKYISGSGLFKIDNFTDGALYSTTGYGNFLQSGLLTGIQNISTGDGVLTGNLIIIGNNFAWATGNVSGIFSGIGTGLASGIGYTGRAMGSFTGQLLATILDGSGTFNINTSEAGIGFGPMTSIDYPAYINATGFINLSGLQYNDYFYIGVTNIPLIKGLQYNDQNSLISYLSGNSIHQVNGVNVDGLIYLTSLYSGDIGNGTIIKSGKCDYGYLIASPFLTGGAHSGTTGNLVYNIGQPFTGGINLILTGTGNYSAPISGITTGEFIYTRTFTGVWSMFTGLNANSLVKVPSFNNILSGKGTFPPNSTVNFQIDHLDSDFNIDYVELILSGKNVINPFTTIISQ